MLQDLLLLLLCSYLPALLIPRWHKPSVLRQVRFGLFAGLILLGGWVVLHVSPQPAIDVWNLQQEGAQVLSAGGDPYSRVAVSGTGAPTDGSVPYAYPPLQLYATLPAFLLGHDVRYAMVVMACLALRLLSGPSRRIPALAQDAPALLCG